MNERSMAQFGYGIDYSNTPIQQGMVSCMVDVFAHRISYPSVSPTVAFYSDRRQEHIHVPAFTRSPSNDIEHWSFPEASDDTTCNDMAVEDASAWHEIDFEMLPNANTTIVTPIGTKVQPRTTAETQTDTSMTEDNLTVEPIMVVSPTEAATFMNARPGGPLQENSQRMVAVERRAGSKLRKKASTSKEGSRALVEISTNLAQQNKAQAPMKSTPIKKGKASSETSNKRTKGPKRKATTGQKAKGAAPTATNVQTTVLSCKYGCAHGGLVTMQQMQPYDTRHYLGEGKYLHKKKCKDCKKQIAALFEHSKRKSVFYYCQTDYRMSELTDDNFAKAEPPCATVLCVECYFARETKKNTSAGKTRRSSTRGHA